MASKEEAEIARVIKKARKSSRAEESFSRLLQLGEQGDPHMDTEEVVSPEDARTVASWAICSVRAQRLRHLNASRFLV